MTDDEKKFDKRAMVDIDLEYPVTVEGKDYLKLTMRRPKMRDSLKAAKQKTDGERAIMLMADLCDVAPNVIQELDEFDAKRLGEQLEAFRGGQSES